MTPISKAVVWAAGLFALFGFGASPALGRDRTYYIAADEVLWNYAPSGSNLISGRKLKPLPEQLGFAYRKIVYNGYTDATFSQRKPRPEAYLGILGPAIYAEVGDTVTIVFKNNAHLPLSVHVHGLRYTKSNEGAPYRDGNAAKPGDAVAPGRTFTYHYDVPERSGPGPMDASSVLWMYHSHTDELRDVNTGLIGPIVVTRKGSANADGTPNDVDREVFTLFAEFDENQSRLFERNLADPAINPHKLKVLRRGFGSGNQLYTINGYMFGNMPMLDVHRGQRTRWYLMATMSDFDFHTPHWQGETAIINGQRTDTAQVSPMSMVVADMIPDNPGTWLYHCQVNVHMMGGMVARYRTLP